MRRRKSAPPPCSRMVKEGHDSTVRPKVQTYEFNNGRLYMDAWAADGKANLSRTFQGRMRVLNVLLCVGMGTTLIFMDWAGNSEHVFSPVRRVALTWWRNFNRLDVADVAKARSVGEPIPPRGPGS